MHHFKIFIELTRLDKPIGFMLLFWPCAWGLAFANLINKDLNSFFYYLILFFIGSVLMRSAGCIFNDIVDKDLDKKVNRTRMRPIPSGRITVKKSFLYITILCALAFIVLIQFNLLTVLLGLGSMFFAFTYPFMKRITYWPQLFLGLTFNWGLIMAWASLNNNISVEIILLYISAIFWTLGYDTVYGAQDMSDDEIIGIKSTSIKFKKNIKLFLATNYLIASLIVIYLFKSFIGQNIFTLFLTIYILSLIYQLLIFEKNKPKHFLKIFKSNNYTGLFLFLGIFSVSITNGI